jgi:acyl-CoA synthetase (AMP-forming)/AMP-acid ligase II
MIDASGLWPLVEARAHATPAALCAVDEHGTRLSFAELAARAERVAAALAERGVATDVRVSWQLPTWIESIVLVAALARLGAVQNPLLPIYREREIGFIVRQVRPKLLVVPRVSALRPRSAGAARAFRPRAWGRSVLAARVSKATARCPKPTRRPCRLSARARRAAALDLLHVGHHRRSEGRVHGPTRRSRRARAAWPSASRSGPTIATRSCSRSRTSAESGCSWCS